MGGARGREADSAAAQAVIRIIFIDMLSATLLILSPAAVAEVIGTGPAVAWAPTGSRVGLAGSWGPGGGVVIA